MIKLIVLTLLQSLFTVCGMGLLNMALDGKTISVRELATALATMQGVAGMLLLFGSFVLTSVILSFARLGVFIPLNTGLVFLATVLWGVLFQQEKLSMPMMLGMVLIVMGVALVSAQSMKQVQ